MTVWIPFTKKKLVRMRDQSGAFWGVAPRKVAIPPNYTYLYGRMSLVNAIRWIVKKEIRRTPLTRG